MSLTPVFSILLACFLIFPLLISGKLGDKSVKIVATFIAAIFATPSIMFFVAVMLFFINIFIKF